MNIKNFIMPKEQVEKPTEKIMGKKITCNCGGECSDVRCECRKKHKHCTSSCDSCKKGNCSNYE